MIRSRSSRLAARIPSGPASTSSTCGQVGQHQDDDIDCVGEGPRGVVPDCSGLDQVVVLLRASPGDVDGRRRFEDVGGHRVTHHPETDHPRPAALRHETWPECT